MTVPEPGFYTADFTADGHVSARGLQPLLRFLLRRGDEPRNRLSRLHPYCGEASLFDDYVALDGATSFERPGSGVVIRHPRGSLRFVPKS